MPSTRSLDFRSTRNQGGNSSPILAIVFLYCISQLDIFFFCPFGFASSPETLPHCLGQLQMLSLMNQCPTLRSTLPSPSVRYRDLQWHGFYYLHHQHVGIVPPSGTADDVFIVQTSGNVINGSGVNMILLNGVKASNIVWQVAGFVDVGTTTATHMRVSFWSRPKLCSRLAAP
jgi:hypothetical protein